MLTVLGIVVLEGLIGATGPASNGGNTELFGDNTLCLCEIDVMLSSKLPVDDMSPKLPGKNYNETN